MSEVKVYSFGVCHCSVCVSKNLTTEQIESQVNLQSPTGIESAWKISEDPFFKSGDSNPCECDKDKNKLHYLLVC